MSNFSRAKGYEKKLYNTATKRSQHGHFTCAVRQSLRVRILAALAIATLFSGSLNIQAAQQALNLQDPYPFIEAQISQDEINEATKALEQIILDIEASRGRYAPELIQPLRILGKAQMATKDYMQAVETFDRAIHLTRINSGLFAPEQVPLVYLHADSYAAMKDFRNAQRREEYAFQVLSNRAQRGDLLAGMQRLGDFYLETYNFLAARTMYRQGYEVLEDNGFGNSDLAVPFLKGTASTYKMERFPPLYSQERRSDEFMQKPENTRNLEFSTEYRTINNFPAGERALQKIIKIRKSALGSSEENSDPKEIGNHQALVNQALLDLADWHLMFGSQKKAHTLYSEIHLQQVEFPAELSIDMDSPKLLYLPAPQNLKPPPTPDRLAAETGSITLEFSIHKNGRIRGLETIAFEPNDAIEFNARRSMRQAIYRPAMVEGDATLTHAHRYTHTYTFFPSRKGRNKELRELEQLRLNEQEQDLKREQKPDKPENDKSANQTNAVNANGKIIDSMHANNA